MINSRSLFFRLDKVESVEISVDLLTIRQGAIKITKFYPINLLTQKKEFLLQHGIDNIEINDGIDGLNVVAIALIDDRDDDALGHGAPFSFSIVNEGTTKDNKDDFRFLSTAHPRVYLLAYEGEYVSLVQCLSPSSHHS